MNEHKCNNKQNISKESDYGYTKYKVLLIAFFHWIQRISETKRQCNALSTVFAFANTFPHQPKCAMKLGARCGAIDTRCAWSKAHVTVSAYTI